MPGWSASLLRKHLTLSLSSKYTYPTSRPTSKSQISLYFCFGRYICSGLVCILHKESRDIRMDRFWPDSVHSIEGTNALTSIMHALYITKICVKNLISDHACGFWRRLHKIFDVPQAQALAFGEILRFLSKLQLTLTTHDYENQRYVHDADMEWNLAKILAAAASLE